MCEINTAEAKKRGEKIKNFNIFLLSFQVCVPSFIHVHVHIHTKAESELTIQPQKYLSFCVQFTYCVWVHVKEFSTIAITLEVRAGKKSQKQILKKRKKFFFFMQTQKHIMMFKLN